MRLVLLLIVLMFHTQIYAHSIPNPTGFLVNYQPGSKWNDKLPYKKQKNISKHVFFLRDRFKQGKVSLAGNDGVTQLEFLVILGVESESKVRALLDSDPNVVDKLLTYSVRTVTITHIDKSLVHQHDRL